jgi:hypothetical protein
MSTVGVKGFLDLLLIPVTAPVHVELDDRLDGTQVHDAL